MKYVILLVFLPLFTYSQKVIKYRATEFSIRQKVGDTANWKPSKTLIVLKEDQVTFYSPTEETFDIISKDEFLQEGHPEVTVLQFQMIDNKGRKCELSFLKHTDIFAVSVYYPELDFLYMYKIGPTD